MGVRVSTSDIAKLVVWLNDNKEQCQRHTLGQISAFITRDTHVAIPVSTVRRYVHVVIPEWKDRRVPRTRNKSLLEHRVEKIEKILKYLLKTEELTLFE